MEDFKQKIADLTNWQEENKDTRAIVVIALEDKGDNNHSLSAIFAGKSVNIIQALYSAFKNDKQFMRFARYALGEYNRRKIEPLIDKIIQEFTEDEEAENTEENNKQ